MLRTSSSSFIFLSRTLSCSLCVCLPPVLRCNFRELSTAPEYRHNWHRKYNKHPILISAYEDQNIHGFERGVGACFAEPIESWLSVLSDAVPFIRDCLVVAPSTMSLERLDALLRRAQVHFPQVHVAQLERVPDSTTFAQSLTNKRSIAINSKAISLSAPTHMFTSPLEQIAEHSLDVVVFADNVFGTEMLFDSPWHISLAAKALKPHGVLALFGYNTHIELTNPLWARKNVEDYLVAHEREVQRIISNIEKIRHERNTKRCEEKESTQDSIFTASSNNIFDQKNGNFDREIKNDECTELEQKETVHAECQISEYQRKVKYLGKVENNCDVNKNANDVDYHNSKNEITHQERCTDIDILTNALEHAEEEQRSINAAHADTYIPFLAVKRKWFISEYALSTSTLIAYLRSLPTYTLLHKWLKNPHYVNMSEVNFGEVRCDGDDDFVDINNSIPQNTDSNIFSNISQSSSAHKESSREVKLMDINGNKKYNDNKETRRVFVQRKVNEVDHLEALYYCLEHHLQAIAHEHLCDNEKYKHHSQVTFSQSDELKSRRAYSAFAPLRGVIHHFTVVCSNRSMNCIDSSNKFAQLSSSAKPQYQLE